MPKQSDGQTRETAKKKSDDKLGTQVSSRDSPPDGSLTRKDSAHLLSSRGPENIRSEYRISSHTVRITKHGYAIEPVELRYREILGNLSAMSRRASELTFDPTQIGHKVLSLIRGFWSQPAFPRGRQVARADKHVTIESIIEEFKLNPLYPHRETRGGMAMNRSRSPRSSRSRRHHRRRPQSRHNSSPGSSSSPEQPEASKTSAQSQPQESHGQSFLSLLLPKAVIHPQAAAAPTQVSSSSSPPLEGPSGSESQSDTFYGWLPAEKSQLVELITGLLYQMERVFGKESRIIKIASPCTVLGDIHGNLTDLRSYERSLWPKAPVCLTSSYLFLGDYVDRGEYSVECVLYLFAMKLIAPSRFYLLRGNHEVAAIQRQYTFSRECETKFGQRGNSVWRHFNKVFDLMPVAAVIDEQIFCAHGGIPRSVSDLRRLATEIPSPLDNPEVQCPAAWEILWNDPITDSELIGMIEMDNAVVTQTQTTQTQPSADGRDLVTTTTSSTTISSTKKDNQNQEASAQNQGGRRKSEALSGADAILTREPAEASTFYVKTSDDGQQSSQDLVQAAKVSNGQTVSQTYSPSYKSNNKTDSGKTNDSSDDTLRRVPSDTSSIASTGAQQIISDGFVANIKRGTAYLFSDQAINNFLRVNNLTHVIRAHEVIPTGFAFHGDGRVITIFSSSKYCGLNNQAACALVQGNRIRILRLDTGEAGE